MTFETPGGRVAKQRSLLFVRHAPCSSDPAAAKAQRPSNNACANRCRKVQVLLRSPASVRTRSNHVAAVGYSIPRRPPWITRKPIGLTPGFHLNWPSGGGLLPLLVGPERGALRPRRRERPQPRVLARGKAD